MTQRILMIHRRTDELRRLREVLVREGFGVITASDWETAQKICRGIRIDLLLCETRLVNQLAGTAVQNPEKL